MALSTSKTYYGLVVGIGFAILVTLFLLLCFTLNYKPEDELYDEEWICSGAYGENRCLKVFYERRYFHSFTFDI
jgi:hypothetical protein